MASSSKERGNMGNKKRALVENFVTVDQLIAFKDDLSGYIKYLLRIKAFKSMSAMAEDLGVASGYIRQVKHRIIHKRGERIHRSDYVKRVLQLWAK